MAMMDTRIERETSLLSINGRVNKNNGQFDRNDSPNRNYKKRQEIDKLLWSDSL